MSSPTVSLCMIVKDEERFLKNCLLSIKSLVDEIIIVDTGSKDTTQALALALGAKLFQYRWGEDFSAARNFSLSKATKDWILVMDADETISQKNLPEIRKLIFKDDLDALTLIQRNYFKDRQPAAFELSQRDDPYGESKPYPGWFPSELVRLFRNRKGYRFSGMIHELVEPSIKEKGGKIISSGIPLHHFKDEKPAEFDKAKKKKYLEIGLKEIEANPTSPKPYYEVGKIYLAEKRYDQAIPLLERAVQIINSSESRVEYRSTYSYVFASLGQAYLETGEYTRSAEYLEKLTQSHKHPALLFFLALAYTQLGRTAEAIESYKEAIRLDPANEELYNNLANLYTRSARFEEAVNILLAAIKLAPDSAILYRNLGAAYASQGKHQLAYEAFQKAISLNPEFRAELEEGLKRLKELMEESVEIDYSFSAGNQKE